MSETEKTIRLSKAIKEFNLSMDHIVDFLSKKGFQIESNPNTKLPGDAYALLQKEFLGDKILKEEAQHLTQSKLKREGQVVVDADTAKKIDVAIAALRFDGMIEEVLARWEPRHSK